jgi:hypothetical protein
MDDTIDGAWGCVQRVAAGLLGEICEWRRWKEELHAPRMRWTTALHAHFVHAVELLGGHESTFENAPAVSSSCGAAASTLIT